MELPGGGGGGDPGSGRPRRGETRLGRAGVGATLREVAGGEGRLWEGAAAGPPDPGGAGGGLAAPRPGGARRGDPCLGSWQRNGEEKIIKVSWF